LTRGIAVLRDTVRVPGSMIQVSSGQAMSKAGKSSRSEQLAAFEAVVLRYEAELLRYAARVTSNSDAAQDVVQNTFIRLFRKWTGTLEPTPQLSSWLYRVAHNCAVDHMRKESRRRILHQQQAAEAPELVDPDRGQGFRISEEAERAAAALRKLSPRERELVVLKVYEEKSYREISDITGLTIGNVGYILHHAMKKMSAELGEGGTNE
jgi:RNA polymerase sigma factor (sigma-70 family)